MSSAKLDPERKLRVLLLAPHFDRNVPGESWSTYKWVQGISEQCETVVLTQHKPGWSAADSPTAATEVVNWTEPRLPGALKRFDAELKPGFVLFYFRARRWIKRARRAGAVFDLVHQINPLALRYPCPARGLGIPYIMGPLAGSLTTPPGFAAAGSDRQWYRKLRNFDPWRLRHDPWLRDSYAGASVLLGVAPYVGEHLTPIGIRRFEVMAETGVDAVVSEPKTQPEPGRPLRLLFVGRLIRTKGILEAIRAVARAAGSSRITFDIIGAGDLGETCAQEIARLGMQETITLRGRLPKEEVFRWYARADVFLFPSFREPSGNVVFEALSQGVPIITTTAGGPGFVVDATCGRLVEPTNSAAMEQALAAEILQLAGDRAQIPTLSAGAIERANSLALWKNKVSTLLGYYRKTIST